MASGERSPWCSRVQGLQLVVFCHANDVTVKVCLNHTLSRQFWVYSDRREEKKFLFLGHFDTLPSSAQSVLNGTQSAASPHIRVPFKLYVICLVSSYREQYVDESGEGYSITPDLWVDFIVNHGS